EAAVNTAKRARAAQRARAVHSCESSVRVAETAVDAGRAQAVSTRKRPGAVKSAHAGVAEASDVRASEAADVTADIGAGNQRSNRGPRSDANVCAAGLESPGSIEALNSGRPERRGTRDRSPTSAPEALHSGRRERRGTRD